MIRREQIEELLSLPIDERRRLLRLLQESLSGEGDRDSKPEKVNLRQQREGCYQCRAAILVVLGIPPAKQTKFFAPRSINKAA